MDNHNKTETNHTGCLVCGKPIVYDTESTLRTCALCKRQYESNAVCEDNHYVCDHCHSGNSGFLQFLLNTPEKDPVKIFLQAVEFPSVHMHGPEHHSIVPGALLAAYRNNGGDIQLDKAIDAAMKRGGQVPGGICGFWGVCGAAVGAGIYASIVTGSNPLNEAAWGVPQLLTSQCLQDLAKVGGPRCCKRTSRIAIEAAVDFTKKNFGVTMPIEDAPCTFMDENSECIHKRCPYYKR